MRLIKEKTSIDFLSPVRRRIAISISIILVVVSLISLATRGLDFGIDFTGGVLLEVGYEGPADLEAIRANLAAAGFEDAQVQRFGQPNDVLVRLPPQGTSEAAEVREHLQATLEANGQKIDLRRVEFVSAQVGAELAERGALAMVIALMLIFLYVMLRFQWKFSLGAVAALVHDAIVTVGFFSIFSLPFDLTVVAALLAVIGYSLNDTIVVFDRIRENFPRLRKSSPYEVINKSLNETLARTVMTGLTTLLVLIALFIFGGEIIHAFAFTLIVGIIVGTYSSIYVASAALLLLGVSKFDLMQVEKEGAGAKVDAQP
jgi:preprotein translocase subunit SecF